MGLFALIRDVTAAQFAGNVPVPQRTSVPLKLHQGSSVELPIIDLALAQADGSILPNVLLTRQLQRLVR